MIGVWLGTGVGGALMHRPALYLGVSGLAGDLGHYLLHSVDVPPRRPARSPRQRRIAHRDRRTRPRRWWRSIAPRNSKKLAGTDVNDIKSGDLAEAIRKGDKSVETLVRSRATSIGTALSNLVDFLNPDMIVLGGGLLGGDAGALRSEIRK